jgi:alpha,alpha-trehalase
MIVVLCLCLSTVFAEFERCQSPIYCQGPFLAKMQDSQVSNDSKHFVDRPLRAPIAEVLNAFNLIPSGSPPSVYKQFADQWMYPSGYEVSALMPTDWVEHPEFVNQLPSALQPFALSLHSKWRTLVRTFNYTGLCDGCYSSIPVPHPFVVAGGRFVEFYYWDSYWALQGLLVSNMTTTAQNVVDNLLYIVDTYGFVPNGGRIYYLSRSQPPVLTLMVHLMYERSGDVVWLKKALDTLEKEYSWWQQNRMISYMGKDGWSHKVSRYVADTFLPRPESYREDVLTASILPVRDRSFCYRDLASAAESGWDFSSRWLKDWNQISTIRTSNVLPVDLNSILYVVETTLTQLYGEIGNDSRSAYFELESKKRASVIHRVFWDEFAQSWGDIAMTSAPSGTPFYISNLLPIWAKAYHQQTPQEALQIIQRIWPQMMFPGGVPTSFIMSKQQWDFPNAWAPLQQFLIDGLDALKLPEATKMADQLAITWFNSNYCAWQATLNDDGGLFFEKYDVTHPGVAGGGGEYQVQTGFGWTNGVLLKLLKTRGHMLQVPTCANTN